MTRLVVQAERIKLETLLEKHPGELAYLENLSLDTLVRFREEVTTIMFEGHAALFERLAGAGGILPMKLRVLLAEKALGATLCARVAGYTPVERAIAMAENLHVPFMADVATRMDPQRARPLLQGLSVNHIKAVAHELAARTDVITLGRFVDALPVSVTQTVMNEMDDASVLRSSFFVNDRSLLDEVTRTLPDERRRRIIASAREQELYREALALVQAVDVDLGGRLADMAAEEPGFLAGLMETVHRDQLWADTLPLARIMSPENRRQLLDLPRLSDEDVLRGLVDACEREGLWEELEALGEEIAPMAREGIRKIAAERGLSLPEGLRA